MVFKCYIYIIIYFGKKFAVKIAFNIDLLSNFYDNLKLILSGKNGIVNFLDLNIELDYIYSRVKVTLYIKPTQTFSFLLTNSNHPDFIFKNNPKSILIRIRRNCTDLVDYLYYSNLYLIYFLKRGYSFIEFCKISNMVANLNRDKLLEYKIKKSKQKTQFSLLNTAVFDKNLLNLKEIFLNSFNNLKKEYVLLKPYKLSLLNKMQTNMGSLLVHNIFSLNLNIKNFKYLKCDDLNCNVCIYNSKSNIIKVNQSLTLPIDCISSCDSICVIYIINCKKCNAFYIGETYRSVKERLLEHIRSIKYFIPFISYHTPVSTHFNLESHSLKDFKFYIYKKDLLDDNVRKNYEARTICLFKNHFKAKILNKLCPNPYFIKRY